MTRPVRILLVEDNPGDVRLTSEAFKETPLMNDLFVVNDGVEAIEFLQNKSKYGDVPRPDFILLDLNLPRKDGREVLKEIKEHPKLRRIPVVVLTTSTAREDIVKTYDLHTNCYITKPVDMDAFIEIVQAIEKFWVDVVKLPPE